MHMHLNQMIRRVSNTDEIAILHWFLLVGSLFIKK